MVHRNIEFVAQLGQFPVNLGQIGLFKEHVATGPGRRVIRIDQFNGFQIISECDR